MKRVISILLITVFAMLMLTACAADPLYNNTSTADQAATETQSTVDINNYTKDFKGMQKYLQALELIKSDTSTQTELYADILGADKAVRYTLNSSAFIEFYSYSTEKNDIAKQVFEQIESGKEIEIAGLDPLTGVISDSGNFIAVYNKKISYDYDKIITEFKKF